MPTVWPHAGKADDDVLGVVGLQLEEVAIVHGLENQLLHVVGLVGVVRHQGVQRQSARSTGRWWGARELFLVVQGR
jgi:hypothetical protein